MSWDILIQDLPKDAHCVADIPNDYRPNPLGPRSEMIARIQQVLPGANFSDPSWGILDQAEFSIEFNMGSGEICDSVMLHVRGGGSAAIIVTRLLEQLNLCALDLQAGEFFSPQVAEGSFDQWQAYRDKVIKPEDSHDI
jgi:hypothetical protein